MFYYGNISAIRQNTNQYNFNYAQGWETGTLANVGYDNQRLTNNISRMALGASFYNPELDAGWKVTVRQHLLQGWGIDNNRRQIIIAHNDAR